MDNRPKVPPVIKDPHNKPVYDFEHPETIAGIDPLAPRHANFDWDLLRELLGEPLEPEELKAALRDVDMQKLCKALAEVLQFVLVNKELRSVGKRFIALCWVLNPALFNGASARTVARDFGLCRTTMAKATGDASRTFGIRNHAQSHAANFNAVPAQS